MNPGGFSASASAPGSLFAAIVKTPSSKSRPNDSFDVAAVNAFFAAANATDAADTATDAADSAGIAAANYATAADAAANTAVDVFYAVDAASVA